MSVSTGEKDGPLDDGGTKSVAELKTNIVNVEEGISEKSAGSTESTEYVPNTLVSGSRLALIFIAFMMAFLLVALDQTILSTALPTIASRFDAVKDISWIASAYFLPQASFMLFFGRVLTIAPAKIVFLVTVGIFELGSLFCAIAPSVNFLIFGRAVAGLGGAGMWVSIMSIIARITTLQQRPVLMGLFGAVFAVSSVIGPLIGGAFSDHVSWRWCFYINLPLGAVALLAITFILPNHPPNTRLNVSQFQAWLNLDWLGTFLSVAVVTMLMLPLQWAGSTKPWNDPVIISLLVTAIVPLALFILWEKRRGDQAVLPLSFFRRRNICGAFLGAGFSQIAFVVAIYYLPLLYQIKGHSATKSGIDILPYMVSCVSAALATGSIIAKTGYPWPFMVLSPLVAGVGFGMMYTTNVDTSISKLIGYQILAGAGLGAILQNAVIIAQAEYVDNEALVPQATSLVTFMQIVGAAIGLSIAGGIFSSQLRIQVGNHAPNLSADIKNAVLSNIEAISQLPEAEKILVKAAYSAAIDRMFLIAVAGCAAASVAALIIRRSRITVSKTAGGAL
ncbi:ABC transporter [Pholiota conissans]|uniref:ABC transporter n=1 Tax=Pholiota conissans TaxID=109636 RepID=A0A9P5ZAT4_9AGAR|nr:ABC transporter [Pholiota conissans]